MKSRRWFGCHGVPVESRHGANWGNTILISEEGSGRVGEESGDTIPNSPIGGFLGSHTATTTGSSDRAPGVMPTAQCQMPNAYSAFSVFTTFFSTSA